MSSEIRIKNFIALGQYLLEGDEQLDTIIRKAAMYNSWFDENSSRQAIAAVANEFLDAAKLNTWVSQYDEILQPKTIGIVAAGNIPLVSFHDILAVLISGHRLLIKYSDKDKYLTPFILQKLVEINDDFSSKIFTDERWKNYDAVIATGSNNTSRYFEQYFGQKPNIIRKNRHSVAVLTGKETEEDLYNIGIDVFSYYGLGCRNVSKLWVPENYDFTSLAKSWQPFYYLMEHNSYKNNLDYQRTLYMMNGTPFLNIDFVNITQNDALSSPISCLHYAYYQHINEVKLALEKDTDSLQCVVSTNSEISKIKPGEAQKPGLTDYADNVDVMKFLSEL